MSKWYPCVYCTEDLKCTKTSGDGVISFCVLGPCHDETPSNADRIRAKNDEELAKLLTDAQCPSDLGGTDKCENPPPHTSLDSILCRECWLDWLRQEET